MKARHVSHDLYDTRMLQPQPTKVVKRNRLALQQDERSGCQKKIEFIHAYAYASSQTKILMSRQRWDNCLHRHKREKDS